MCQKSVKLLDVSCIGYGNGNDAVDTGPIPSALFTTEEVVLWRGDEGGKERGEGGRDILK